MLTVSRLAILVFTIAALTARCAAAETKDIKNFVKEAFRDNIEGVKKGIYCAALSCDFEIESFYATETEPQTYALSTTGWLEGTIPGLRGSAKRSMGLTGSYTRGTCVIKELNPVFDITTTNNGWGASRIEHVFKRIEIPKVVILTKKDCDKVDSFIQGAT
jgi:hypothetical protein